MRFRQLTALTAVGMLCFGIADANAENDETSDHEAVSSRTLKLSQDLETTSGASAEHSDTAQVHWHFGAKGWGDDRDTSTIQIQKAPPVSAPEVDSRSAVCALTVLLGGLAVLRGRRTARRHAGLVNKSTACK